MQDRRIRDLKAKLANTTNQARRDDIEARLGWIAEDMAEARQEREEMDAGYGTFARGF